MIDPAYFEKIAARLHRLEDEIADPATAVNQRRFRDVVKEHSRLRRVLDKSDAYFRLKRDVDEQRALVAAEDADPDLKALALEAGLAGGRLLDVDVYPADGTQLDRRALGLPLALAAGTFAP